MRLHAIFSFKHGQGITHPHPHQCLTVFCVYTHVVVLCFDRIDRGVLKREGKGLRELGRRFCGRSRARRFGPKLWDGPRRFEGE
jgi:hypothetical protein